MGLLAKIFGSEKALGGIVDGVTKGLDALAYTEEEKEKAAAENRSEARKMVIDWMANTSGQNLARRWIAIAVTGVWLLMYVLSTLMRIVSPWLPEAKALLMVESAEAAKDMAVDMNPAVMLIIGFYFAAPHMGGIAKAVTERFVKKTNAAPVTSSGPDRTG